MVMMGCGIWSRSLPHPPAIGKFWTGIISKKIFTKWVGHWSGSSKLRRYCGQVRWRWSGLCLVIADSNRQRTSVLILSSIVNALLTTVIISPNNYVQLASWAVESAIKQIGSRIKISGAQWKAENVNQVLSVRCAYLNGVLALWGQYSWFPPLWTSLFLVAIASKTPAACSWKKTWVIACVTKTFFGERSRQRLLLDCPFRTPYLACSGISAKVGCSRSNQYESRKRRCVWAILFVLLLD